MADPVGIPESEIIKAVAQIEAFGEMMIPPLPPGQLQAILAKMRATLTEQPTPPAKPPTP